MRAELYIEREVLKCDSILVSDHLACGPEMPHGPGEPGFEWSYDNITNLYPDPSEWDADRCVAWMIDHGHDPVRLDAGRAIYPGCDADTRRDEVRDHAEPAEVYEWWAVSDWLARQLTGIGECVLDNAYGYWWGRQATGQAMKIDGTLQQIARAFDDR